MSQRTVIITEIISPYRIPVFNALAHKENLDLHVIFLSETDEVLRKWLVYKDEINFAYQVLPSWRWRSGNRTILVNRGLRPALNTVKPQVIICGGYNYQASWEALWWARRRGVRFVLWSESNQSDQRSGRAGVEWLKRYFLRRCDGFVVPGKSSFSYLRTLGAAEKGIYIAPNAVDTAFFKKAAESAPMQGTAHRKRLGLPARYILYAGRLVSEKGVFDLLDAYSKLETDLRSEVGLVFAGDGASRGRLIEQAQRIQPGVVRFSGFAQREDLAVLYSLAEVLVLPTHSDPWGLVVNEAMVCGLPIVVTSVAGCAADLVEDGWNGYVVPPRDPERLSVAIDSVLRQPELKQRMSAHSLERTQNYSPETCADGLAAAAISAGTRPR